jgi:hypothetical protein
MPAPARRPVNRAPRIRLAVLLLALAALHSDDEGAGRDQPQHPPPPRPRHYRTTLVCGDLASEAGASGRGLTHCAPTTGKAPFFVVRQGDIGSGGEGAAAHTRVRRRSSPHPRRVTGRSPSPASIRRLEESRSRRSAPYRPRQRRAYASRDRGCLPRPPRPTLSETQVAHRLRRRIVPPRRFVRRDQEVRR